MSLPINYADYYPEFATNDAATTTALRRRLVQLANEGHMSLSGTPADYYPEFAANNEATHAALWEKLAQLTKEGNKIAKDHQLMWPTYELRHFMDPLINSQAEVTNYPQLMLEEPIAPHCREVVAIYSNKKGRDVMKALGREEEILGILQKELGTDMRPKWYFAYETITHPVWGFKYQ